MNNLYSICSWYLLYGRPPFQLSKSLQKSTRNRTDVNRAATGRQLTGIMHNFPLCLYLFIFWLNEIPPHVWLQIFGIMCPALVVRSHCNWHSCVMLLISKPSDLCSMWPTKHTFFSFFFLLFLIQNFVLHFLWSVETGWATEILC